VVTSVDVARLLADTLVKNHIEYAIGGALAVAYYANPRATVDVDINIFAPPETGLDHVLEVLKSVGFEPDNAATLSRTAKEDGQFRGRLAGIRVDVFVPAIAFYAALNTRKRQVSLLDGPLNILGPEDLLILKMMFFRRKDLADAEAMLRGGNVIDLNQVRTTLVEFVGAQDERIREWDKLVQDVYNG
jgi:hypothetical protein